MKSVKELFGLRLRELRRAKGLSQAEIAEMINVDSKHVSRLETGKTFPYPETLEMLAKALNVPVKEFFEFGDQDGKDFSVEGIGKLLTGVGEEKLRLVYRVVKAIVM